MTEPPSTGFDAVREPQTHSSVANEFERLRQLAKDAAADAPGRYLASVVDRMQPEPMLTYTLAGDAVLQRMLDGADAAPYLPDGPAAA